MRESHEDALRREIREELEMEITVGDLIDTIEYDYPAFHLSMKCFCPLYTDVYNIGKYDVKY